MPLPPRRVRARSRCRPRRCVDEQRGEHGVRDDGSGEQPRSSTSRSGGSGSAADAVTETSERTSDERTAPVIEPPIKPKHATRSARSRRWRADRRGRGALRLEVEELAALVAAIAGDSEQQADERESKRERGRRSERDQRAARERIGAQARKHMRRERRP